MQFSSSQELPSNIVSVSHVTRGHNSTVNSLGCCRNTNNALYFATLVIRLHSRICSTNYNLALVLCFKMTDRYICCISVLCTSLCKAHNWQYQLILLLETLLIEVFPILEENIMLQLCNIVYTYTTTVGWWEILTQTALLNQVLTYL